MSLKFEDIVAIRDSEGLTTSEKLCLTIIYSRGNEHTASIPTLTKNMGFKSERYVRSLLAGLKDKGVINIVNHSGETSDISINTRALQALVPTKVTPALQSTPAPQSRAPRLPRAPHPGSPEPTKENLKDNKKEKAVEPAGAASLSLEAKKAKTKDMTASIIAEKRERSVVKDGEQDATPALQSRGTPDGPIDYAELAGQDKSIKFYYDKHMNIEGMKPKAAYKLACRKAGKEVKA